MSGPNAFSMRSAIYGVSAALPWSKSESVARRTFKISDALDTLRPSASMISVLIKSPGWGGFFMGISGLLVLSGIGRDRLDLSVSLLAALKNIELL